MAFPSCFAVDFSPFLPFSWLVLPSFFICAPCPVTRLVTISSRIRYPVVQLERGKVSRCRPSHSPSMRILVNLRSLRQFSREVILLFFPFLVIVLGLSRVVNNKPLILSFGESYMFLVYCGSSDLIFRPNLSESGRRRARLFPQLISTLRRLGVGAPTRKLLQFCFSYVTTKQ